MTFDLTITTLQGSFVVMDHKSSNYSAKDYDNSMHDLAFKLEHKNYNYPLQCASVHPSVCPLDKGECSFQLLNFLFDVCATSYSAHKYRCNALY